MTQGQPLFRSLGPDGGEYLLVVEGTERWTILLDGALVAAGPTDEEGIHDAIATFRALPVATPRRVLRAPRELILRSLAPLPTEHEVHRHDR